MEGIGYSCIEQLLVGYSGEGSTGIPSSRYVGVSCVLSLLPSIPILPICTYTLHLYSRSGWRAIPQYTRRGGQGTGTSSRVGWFLRILWFPLVPILQRLIPRGTTCTSLPWIHSSTSRYLRTLNTYLLPIVLLLVRVLHWQGTVVGVQIALEVQYQEYRR